MFSGIVCEIGKIKEITPQGGSVLRVEITAPKTAKNASIGDSISVNGICLTVVSVSKGTFTVELVSETLKVTTAKKWKVETLVNLEPSLSLGEQLGGHLVTGHIDGISKIRKISPDYTSKDSVSNKAEKTSITTVTNRKGKIMQFTLPPELRSYLVPKGSITVDGVSLTIAALFPDSFTVALIPHTLNATTLRMKKEGDKVNLEVDMIGKFVIRYLEESFLNEGEKQERKIKK